MEIYTTKITKGHIPSNFPAAHLGQRTPKHEQRPFLFPFSPIRDKNVLEDAMKFKFSFASFAYKFGYAYAAGQCKHLEIKRRGGEEDNKWDGIALHCCG